MNVFNNQGKIPDFFLIKGHPNHKEGQHVLVLHDLNIMLYMLHPYHTNGKKVGVPIRSYRSTK